MADGVEKVGYCRPPVATRFKPGQSGNPSGERKPRPSLSQRLDRILAEKMTVAEAGESKRMSREEVFLRQTVSRAINGDRQFGKLILEYLQRRQEAAPAEAISSTDEFLMNELKSILGEGKSK